MSTFETIIKKNNIVSNYLEAAEREAQNLNIADYTSNLEDLKNSFYDVSTQIDTLNSKADKIYLKRHELYENLITTEFASYYGKKIKSLLTQTSKFNDVKNILDTNLKDSKISNNISEINHYLSLDKNIVNNVPELNTKLKTYGNNLYEIFCEIRDKLGYSELDFENGKLTGFDNNILFSNDEAYGMIKFIKNNEEMNIEDNQETPTEAIISLILKKDIYKQNGTSNFPFIISTKDDFKNYLENGTDDEYYILNNSIVIDEENIITKNISNLDLNGFRLEFRKDSEITFGRNISNGSIVFKSDNNSDVKVIFDSASLKDISFYTSTNINISGTNGSTSSFSGELKLFAIQGKNELKVSGSGFKYEGGILQSSSGAILNNNLTQSRIPSPKRLKNFSFTNKNVFLDKSFTEVITRENDLIKIKNDNLELELNQKLNNIAISKLVSDSTNISFSDAFNISKDEVFSELPNIYRLLYLLGSISEIRKLNFNVNNLQKDINELLVLLDGSFISIIKSMIEENLKMIDDYISSFSSILNSRKSNDSGYSNSYTENLEEILTDVSDNILTISSPDISSEDNVASYFLNANIALGKFNQEAQNLLSGIIPSIIKINGYIDDYIIILNSDENYGDKLITMLKALANSIGSTDNSSFKFRCFSFRDYESWRDGILSYTSEGICGLVPLYIAQELGINANEFSVLDTDDEAILYKKLVNDSLERIARKKLLRSKIKYEEELNYEGELINRYNLKVVEEPSREELPYSITDLIPGLKTLNNTNIESIIQMNIQAESDNELLLDENEYTKPIYNFVDLELVRYIFKTQYDKEISERIYGFASIFENCKQNFKLLLVEKRFMNIVNNIINLASSDKNETIISETYLNEIKSSLILLNSINEKIRKYIAVWLFRTCTSNTISCSAIGDGEKTLLKYLYTRESAVRSYEFNKIEEMPDEDVLSTIFGYIKDFYNNAVDFITGISTKIYEILKSVLGL